MPMLQYMIYKDSNYNEMQTKYTKSIFLCEKNKCKKTKTKTYFFFFSSFHSDPNNESPTF